MHHRQNPLDSTRIEACALFGFQPTRVDDYLVKSPNEIMQNPETSHIVINN
jgi:hypothetical protein